MSIPHTGLRDINRFITTHDPQGMSVVCTEISEQLPWTTIPDANFGLAYATKQFPIELNDAVDIQSYSNFLRSPPGLTTSGGTVLRYVDMKPGSISPLHRTVSLDYGIVLEGDVELVLDSGETKWLRRGDTVVQRGTNHAWRNPHPTQWSRMVFILIDAKALEIGGKKLDEVKVEGIRDSN